MQDRIEDAIRVFEKVDLTQLKGEHDTTAQIAYDYMRAYFEFFKVGTSFDQDFKVVRDIITKWTDCQIPNFRVAFNKLAQQMRDIDGLQVAKTAGITTEAEPTAEEKAAAIENCKRRAPGILEINLDEVGQLTVETINIETLRIKYYLIDSEVLFSRQPFVKEQTEQFSFVLPQEVLNVPVDSGNTTSNVPIPDKLKGKNLVIEVQSSEIQRFKTFFWADLTVQFNESYGELHVLHKKTRTPLPKTYVKVFAKCDGNQEKFFRDGFTDIRGKFDYASASGISVDSVEKFAVFVDHEEYGSLVKEVENPNKLK